MNPAKGEIDQRPHRFYSEVSVVGEGDAWSVQLDGKALRTPDKKRLVLPTRALAAVIADEWSSQGERIDLQSMFNMRLANVAIDRAPLARAEMVKEAARYAETDLVCHLAEAPAVLNERQTAAWTPLREWAAETLGVKLEPVVGLLAKAQSPASLEAVRMHASSLDDFRLTALLHGVAMMGSVVLGLAVERRRLTAGEAFELSRIDEAFQAAQWGEDAEAARRTDRTRAEARALDLWLDALPLQVR
ncbi:MAG TPA: ATP12 family protein [Hyphomonadaceae bacterium]|nr:ATP12 family protein [Hyphomonadaceae bacterium]